MTKGNASVALLAATLVACDQGTTFPEPAVATAIDVSPGTVTLSESGTQQFVATARDKNGHALTGVSVTWQSDRPDLVAIDANGRATSPSLFAGWYPAPLPVKITAMAGTLSASATVSVVQRGQFNVWPDTNVLYVGMTRALRPRMLKTLRGYPGNALQDTVPKFGVVWSTSNPSVVTMGDTGVVTTVGAGRATITATYDNRTATAEIYVSAPPATPLRFTTITSGSHFIDEHPSDRNYPVFSARGCGLTSDGAAYCWGAMPEVTQITDRCEGSNGGAGGYHIARFRCSEIPLRVVPELTFTTLMNGGSFSCGIATSKRVYCWGTNRVGELGIGTTDTTVHAAAPIADAADYTALYGSGNFAYGSSALATGQVCGLRADGALLCWGDMYGTTPIVIGGSVTWRSIATAGDCGLAADSTAYCFTSGTAQRVGGTTRWLSIATSKHFDLRCALALDRSVYCGSNLDVKRTSSPETLVSLVSYWTRLGVDFETEICGLTADGDVSCSFSFIPTNLGVKVKRLFGHCGLATDDKVYCWRSGTFALVPGQ